MDKETLIKKLDELGIPAWEYSFSSTTNPTCYSIVGYANRWPVIFTDEKGEQNILVTFYSPEEAYDYLYNIFVKEAARLKKMIIPKWRSEYLKKIYPDKWEVIVKRYKGVEE